MSCGITYMEFVDDKRWMYWYDRSIRLWIIQELDAYGNQLHDECDYESRKQGLLESFPAFTFTPEPENIKFEISIHLLRYYIQQRKRWKVMAMRIRAEGTLREALTDEEWNGYQELMESARESL